MNSQEIEFREETNNLLCFKIIKNETSVLGVRFKNGKKEKEYTLEDFIKKMNQYFEGSNLQLKIVEN